MFYHRAVSLTRTQGIIEAAALITFEGVESSAAYQLTHEGKSHRSGIDACLRTATVAGVVL